MWENVASGPCFFNDRCDKTTVRGPMEAGKNSVIYMGLVPGPNKADNICGKTNVTGIMQRGSTVLYFITHIIVISKVRCPWLTCDCLL